ncbi:MAG: hypothetical protein MUF81_19310 [Verrucomicrobia bacterium]|jgi:hypothetical protein|nr:hypothetical protein [Verrucomicrobiota bacterium]
MGLDAVVYCDCCEKGRLLEPPPLGASLRVAPDGSIEREPDAESLEADLAFDQWREQSACEHAGGVLLHHYLGNISLIGSLRSELQREAERFPLLLTRVLYSGTHAGDYLALDIIPALQRELESLAVFRCSTQEAAGFIAEFRAQMSSLAATALSVGKPITF